jgi:hypothetical protein
VANTHRVVNENGTNDEFHIDQRAGGKGHALFDGVNKRLSLDLVQAKSTESGRVIVSYRT